MRISTVMRQNGCIIERMIMIIGSERDYHAQHILERLQARGTPCFFLDTVAFPEKLVMGLSPTDGEGGGFLKTPEGKQVPLSSIRSVYWRFHHGIEVNKELPPELRPIIYREIESALGSLFRNMPHVLWVNPYSAIDRHRYKAHQLYLMAQAGMRVPDTLVTNDPDAVRAFSQKHQGRIIYKPVAGGAHTAQVNDVDLSDERLKDLRISPVQFQEMIEGVDVRVYVIGDELFAADIRAETLDFRDDPKAPIVPLTVPDEIAQQCLEVARMFEYAFTGIDLRRSPDGQYCFIEANPSPMFVHFEKVSGYPLTEKLIALLEKGKNN